MSFHIVFVSSYSSQLGFLISFLNHLNRISTIKKKQIIFIIQLPTKGDPQTKYSLHNFSTNDVQSVATGCCSQCNPFDGLSVASLYCEWR